MAKIIEVRFRYGIAFLLSGLVLLGWICWRNICEILSWGAVHYRQVIWCVAWSLLGMGAGLINSRNKGSEYHAKYLVYFLLFVLSYTRMLWMGK